EIEAVNGILLDLGVSSMQLDKPERGFSFRHDAPLDMRMSPDGPVTAADLLRDTEEVDLRRILWRFGEEKGANAIARAIVRRREQKPLTRTLELATLVEDVLGPRARRYRIHPATRTFQALRIAVNNEIVGLTATVHDAIRCLAPGGRLAVIGYHSLESRAVKHAMRDDTQRCLCPRGLPVCGCGTPGLVKPVTKRAVRPSSSEIDENPRSRSAQLRVVERL
ncbi:MAG: 16S rRNA (cytosine(1402)-N(4))-methyltransferase RsmH, partial [Acidobacteriota bacterium]|nr:16S rRNA (cytosine(1402)-N(4))-methyltransferase RsmH [Acidobacteriota bacterium]